MSDNTPGPWAVGRKFEVGPRSDADDQTRGFILPLADVFGDNREADARLIAAAPALLDALLSAQLVLQENRLRLPQVDAALALLSISVSGGRYVRNRP